MNNKNYKKLEFYQFYIKYYSFIINKIFSIINKS